MNVNLDSKQDFLTVAKERHAVKRYDRTYRMSEDEIKELLRIASQAPSAWNLQHWHFLVVTDQASKDILLGIANGQQQVVEASATVAILGDLQADRNAESIFEADVQAGRLSPEIKANLILQIQGAYTNKSNWARDQAFSNASLAAMQLMLAAKAMGLDSCPMSGFNPDKLIEAFAIPDRYVPVMLVAIGKAAEPARPSVRLPVEERIHWNGFGFQV